MPADDEARHIRAIEKALDTAIEFCKQQITFAGILLALSATFSRQLVSIPDRLTV